MECAKCSSVETKPRIVYACSGCADVGELADQVSRKLRKDGFATPKSSCLAGIGAGLKSFIDAAADARSILTIDGCSVSCAKLVIEKAGLTPLSVILTDMGVEKGNTAVTPELTAQLSQTIVKRFS